MAEWLKAHAWKVCIRQRIEGSNPSLSAIFRFYCGSSHFNKSIEPASLAGFLLPAVLLRFTLLRIFGYTGSYTESVLVTFLNDIAFWCNYECLYSMLRGAISY